MAVHLPDGLQAALAAYHAKRPQAPDRMIGIQRVIQAELNHRFASVGPLLTVQLEQAIKVKHRNKTWDVSLSYAKRPQLAISTKSISSNWRNDSHRWLDRRLLWLYTSPVEEHLDRWGSE